MYTLKIRDPHAFCPGNKLHDYLKNEVAYRQSVRRNFPRPHVFGYTVVTECERELMYNVQGFEEENTYSHAHADFSATPNVYGDSEEGYYPRTQRSSTPFEQWFRATSGNFNPRESATNYGVSQLLSLKNESIQFCFTVMESIMSLIHQMKRATDFRDVYYAIGSFVRSVTGKPVVYGIRFVLLPTLKEWLQSGWDFVTEIQSDEDDRPDTSANPFAKFRFWLNKIQSVTTHPCIEKLKKIFYYIMSFSLLEKFGITFDTFWFSKAHAEYVKSKHNDNLGFLESLADGASFILERLYDCYRTKSWSPIIHSGHNYGKWVDEVYLLKEQAQMLHNPQANGISYHEFLGRLETSIEQGEAICRYGETLDAGTRTLLKRLLSELRLIKADECSKKAARQARQTPFSILYFGGSGIGKSTLQTLCFQHYAKVHGLPTGDEYHYTRSFSDQFWSGFQTSAWSIVLDDVAAKNPDMKQPDPSMEEILQIVNQVPYSPPQADLADKGRTPLRPRLIQASTNTKDLNASAYYCSKLAILRRFPLVVTPAVKAEYCRRDERGVYPPEPTKRMLDSSRTPPLEDGEYPDYWEFTVERVIDGYTNTGQQTAEYQAVGKFTNVYDFLAYISRESIRHEQNQQIVAASAASYSKVTVCTECYRPESKCTCILIGDVSVQIQGKEVDWKLIATGSLLCASLIAAPMAYRVWKRQSRTVKRRLGQQIINFGVECVTEHIGQATPIRVVNDTLESIRQRLSQSGLNVAERLKREAHEVRQIMIEVGDRVRDTTFTFKALLSVITAIPIIVGMYKAYRTFTDFDEQGSREIGSRPTVQDEKLNPWYSDDYIPTTLDVGSLSASWKTMAFDRVCNEVAKNCYYAVARYKRDGIAKMRTLRILCVGGNLCVTNNHNIPDLDCKLSIITSEQKNGVSSNFEMFLGKDDILRFPEEDLAYFRVACMPPRRSLLDMFPGKTFKTQSNGALVSRSELGVPTFDMVRGIHEKIQITTMGDFASWAVSLKRNTEMGECGTALVGDTPVGPVILGLHQTGGSLCRATSVKICKESILQAMAKFAEPMVQAGAPFLDDVNGQPIEIQTLHPKSVFRFIENGVGHVYGSLPGFRAKHTSKVQPTLLADEFTARGYECKVGAPLMRGWVPWRHAAVDIVQQQFNVRQSLLDECVEEFARDILNRLPQDQLDELIILDNATTLNGYPGTKFIDKMKRNTSMGFPYRKKKSLYLSEPIPFEDWQDYVEFPSEFYDRVDDILDRYKNGQRAMPIFIGHLKDEALKLSKVVDGKTRMFSGGPAPWCFVVRKYLLTLVRVIQNNKFIFESAPGTNATSAEWDEIYHYLTHFGSDRIVAGDYSKFDKRMSASWILAAYKVLDKILLAANWSAADRMVITCISYDTAFPLTDFNGDLVEFWGSNPSGHPLTVIINGLVNSLYTRYSWALAGNPLSNFKQHVRLMTYGDDNIMGIDTCIGNFHHGVLVEKLATIGVVYTMADKEAESVPFVRIKDVAFLKRTWRFDEIIGHHVAPLEHDSIAKMLLCYIPSSDKCEEQDAVDRMNTALWEYFFYGKQVFEEKRCMFLEILEKYDLEPYYHREFPTYDDILASYVEDSKDIYPDGICPRC